MTVNISGGILRDQGLSDQLRNFLKDVSADSQHIPTEDQKAALVGEGGAPGAANKYVTANYSNLPTAGQKAALAGTYGTPGAANKYVTDTDPRLSITIVSAAELTLDNGGGTTTTVADTNVTASCRITLQATSANAAGAVSSAAGVYVSAKAAGVSFTVTHPATPGAGSTMDYVIFD